TCAVGAGIAGGKGQPAFGAAAREAVAKASTAPHPQAECAVLARRSRGRGASRRRRRRRAGGMTSHDTVKMAVRRLFPASLVGPVARAGTRRISVESLRALTKLLAGIGLACTLLVSPGRASAQCVDEELKRELVGKRAYRGVVPRKFKKALRHEISA